MPNWEKLNLVNYLEYLNNIIQSRGQWSIPEGEYYEVHHIILRSFDGEPKKINHTMQHNNLIWLTLEEHFEAHRILALDNLDNYKVVFAFMMMSTRKNGEVIQTAEDYAKIRAAFIQHDVELATGKPSAMKNKHFGTDFCKLVSVKTKEAMAKPEIREKLSKANSGKTPWNKGKTTSSEVRQKLSKANLGKKLTAEHRRNIGLGMIGRVVSDSTKEKISAAQRDENSNHNVKVICLETNNIFYSIKNASIVLGISASNISQVCKGKRKSAGGLHFKYYNNVENLEKGVVDD